MIHWAKAKGTRAGNHGGFFIPCDERRKRGHTGERVKKLQGEYWPNAGNVVSTGSKHTQEAPWRTSLRTSSKNGKKTSSKNAGKANIDKVSG